MSTDKIECKLSFCGLEKMQEKKEYCYRLFLNANAKEHLITVLEVINGSIMNQQEQYFNSDGETAENVLKLLYDNAIAPVHLSDVMHNLRFEGCIAMQG